MGIIVALAFVAQMGVQVIQQCDAATAIYMRQTPNGVYEYGVLKGETVGPTIVTMRWGEDGASNIVKDGKTMETKVFMAQYPNPCDLIGAGP